MDQSGPVELDSGLKRRQLRSIPSVDSAMIATPPQSAEPLPEPEVVNGTQKDSVQLRVEGKPAPRPRTRLERLTEKHTPERPNWAIADEGPLFLSSPNMNSRATKHLRRVPNTVFRAPPVGTSSPPLERPEHRKGVVQEERAIQTDLVHASARSNWAFAEDTMPLDVIPQMPSTREQPSLLTQRDMYRGNVHSSHIGLASQGHLPAIEPTVTPYGLVDSGWDQHQPHKPAKPTSLPVYARQAHPDLRSQMGLAPEYNARANPVQWSQKVPGDLRKVASSPSNRPPGVMFFDSGHLQEPFVTERPLYNRKMAQNQALSDDALFNQLMLSLGSVSFRHQSPDLSETMITDSKSKEAYLLAMDPPGPYVDSHQFPQGSVRPMYSAPDLMNKSNVDPSPHLADAFLQVHRPRPVQATEYIGVFPGRPTTPHDPSTPNHIKKVPVPTGTRTLRRVSRLPAVAGPEPQHRPERDDETLGTEPTRTMATMVECGISTESPSLQAQAAEDNEVTSSPSEFRYDGIDSIEGQPSLPHQVGHP